MICLAHWLFDDDIPVDPVADRDDPYFFELCVQAYEALNLEPAEQVVA